MQSMDTAAVLVVVFQKIVLADNVLFVFDSE